MFLRALGRREKQWTPRDFAQHLHREWLLDDPCPRCGDAERSSSGWCDRCDRQLSATPRSLPELAPRLAQAFNLREFHTTTSLCARPYVVHAPGGEAYVLRRAAQVGQALVRAFPDVAVAVEVTFRDPGDPFIVWARTLTRGRSADGEIGYIARRVERYRVSADGRAAECWSFPALR